MTAPGVRGFRLLLDGSADPPEVTAEGVRGPPASVADDEHVARLGSAERLQDTSYPARW
jgi:hypothetical protein